MGVDLATYRARIGCFQNPAPRSVRCRSQASELLVGVILAKLWEKVMGHGPRKLVRCCYLRMSCLLVWFMACKLLLLAGDIEQNPGPTLRETDPDTDEVEEQSLKPKRNDDGLLELDLSGRNMSNVPNKAFQQNDIQVLNLQRNSIKVISMDIGMLFQLRHLDISCNKLSHLPDSISTLSNLEELNISENTIQEFPTGMENMQALKVLIYRNNALVTIPEQVFSFPVIEELDVSDNELSEVSALIGNLLSLKVLNLRWNQSLQTLPQELCQLSNLEEINLSVCDLSCLPDDIGNLRKLKTIKLSCNRISSLPASFFENLRNLEELDLCDNVITEIPESISNLKKLKSFKVADNQLTRLPASIVELTELQTLNVAFNSLSDLPENFENLVEIVYLNLKHNQISRVPFLGHSTFPKLHELNLTGNPIQVSESQLVKDLCERQRVTVCIDHRQYVCLRMDEWKEWDEWDDEMIKGKLVISLSQGYEINAADMCVGHINLSDAGLNVWPQDLDIHNLSYLHLSHNRLEAFPVSSPVVGPSKLSVLDLSHNLLSALPEFIHLLSNLKYLNVSHNKLQSIPPGVYELLSLRRFNMSYNIVQQLPPTATTTMFKNLEHLDLSYNKFQTVPDSILQTQSITYLNLLGNDIASLPADIVRLTNLDTLCYDIRTLQNLSHVLFELKTMPWAIEWTVNCNDMPNSTSAGNKTNFIVRPKVGYLQVETNTKEVTKCEFHEHLQYELNSTIDCLEDTLREVNLSNCNIQSLPEQMSFLSKLTKLDVSNNRLSSFLITLPGWQSLQVLNVSNCSLTVLPDSIGDNLPSLTSLDISRNNLKTMPNSLSNLSRLETLSLQYCGCHQVEFLSNLVSLRHVKMDLAQLISICVCCLDQFSTAGTTISLVRTDDDDDDDVISIDELRGSELHITPYSVKSYPSHEKHSQPLTSISISDINNPDILNCLLSILCTQNLQHLRVSNRCLTALPDSLGDFQSLTSLDISGNPLKTLPSTILQMSTLKVLNVSNCSFTALPDSMGNLQSLTNLDISGNLLKTLPSTILHMYTLQVLNVSNCSLTALPDSLGNLQSLTNLDISENPLKILPSTILHLSVLKVLNVSNCSLTVLPDSIGDNLPYLTSLDISRNNLKTLPNSLSNLHRIETLSLQYCGCHQVEFLANLTSLTHVKVDLAQLISIRVCCLDQFFAAGTTICLVQKKNMWAGYGNVMSVDELRGSGLLITPYGVISYPSHEKHSQPLTSISISDINNPDILNCLLSILCAQNLQHLRVSNCCLTALPDSLGDFQSLTTLDISGNPLKTLPSNKLHMSTLKVLNVSYCCLTALPDSLGDLQSLTDIDMSGNSLKILPSTMLHLSILKVLNVSNCSLTVLPDLIDLPSLTSLDISRNNLKTMPSSLSNLPRIETLSLQYCGCHQVEFLANLTSLRHVKVDLAQLICIRVCCLGQLSAAGTTISLVQSNIGLWAYYGNVISIDELRGSDLHITPSCVKSCPSHEKQTQPLTSISISDIDNPEILNCLLSILCAQNLQHLKVANCSLTSLPDSLGGFQSLTNLDISGQPLKTLPSIILHMSTLKVLNVSNCSLTALPDSLGDLQSLTSLNVSGNPLKNLPSTILHMSTLKVLNVSNCSLTALPDSIGDFCSLTNLDISRNDIKTLPNSFSHLLTLEKLSLQYCGCHQVGFLPNLTSLRHVQVDVTQLISIRVSCLDKLSDAGTSIGLACMFTTHVKPVDMVKLRGPVLDIDPGYMYTEPAAETCTFKDVQPLTSLSITNAELDYMLDVIFSIDSLNVLKLSGCSLQTLPETIQYLSNLTQLDLSNNHLSNLPKGLGKLKMLQKLKLSNCGLNTFLEPSNNTTQQLSNLIALDVSNNTLTALSKGLASLLSLTELNISLNCITDMMLPESIAKLPSLQRLTIFHCGCYEMGFLSELKQLQDLTVDFWQLVSIQKQTAEQLPECVQINLVFFDHELCQEIFLECEEDNLPSYRIALEDLRHSLVKLQCCEKCYASDDLRLSPPDDFKYKGDIIKMEVSRSNQLTLNVIHTLQELIITNCGTDESIGKLKLPVNLTRLDMSSTFINVFDDEYDFPLSICQQNALLQELKMSNCSIQRVSEEIGLLVNLTHLDLSTNSIEDLPDEICNITSLKWLCLRDNVLSILPQRIGNLLSLEYLDVSLNVIHSIPNSIKLLTCMNKLKLFHCGCYQLDFLSELKQLTELTVDFWQLVSVQQQTAEQLPHLVQMKVIYFDHDMFDFVEDEAVKSVRIPLDKLQCGIIELQGQQNFFIPSPPSNFNYVGNIIKMDLSGSSFDEPTLKIGFIHTLQELTVANCDLDLTSDKIDLPANLTKLDVSGNHGHLRCIGQQNALQKLKMSNCSIHRVSKEIALLVNLTHLDLSRNSIEDLPDEICNMTSLKWLCLQHNKLSSLPERIGNLLSLEYLDVSVNILHFIPNSFKLLICMNKLKLFHCGCYQLDFLSELKQLTELFVDFWQLVSVQQQTAKQLPHLAQMKVIYFDRDMCRDIPCDFEEDDAVKSVRIPLDKLQCGIIELQGQETFFIPSPPSDFNYIGNIIKMDLSGNSFDDPTLKIGFIHTLQELTVVNCDLDLTPDEIDLPANLTKLDVSGCHGFFCAETELLHNLIQLDISCNETKYNDHYFPEFIFNQSALLELNMSNCKLKSVTEKIGQLVNLTHLDLSKNNIRYLPDELCSVSSLRWLSLWGNQLSSLPAMIGSLISLEYLNVMFNRITNLPQSFRQLSSMKELKFCHCGCYQVDFLSKLKQLKDLTVDFWQLVSIPRQTAGQLPDSLQIRAVFLKHETSRDYNENSIPSIVIALKDLQCGLVKLKCCHDLFILSPPDDFKYCGDIIKMDLSEIRFSDDTILSIGIIHTLRELSVASSDLDLSSYKIRLPEKLTQLNISCNNDTFYYDNEFPEFICQQSALQELNISNSKVAYVTKKIGQLVSLTHLDLSRNKIEVLPDELCNIASLTWLSLHNNRLSSLPVRIDNLLSLEYLDISCNRFNSAPDSFECLHHLKHLNLSNNSIIYIDSIPLSLCRLQHLQTLDVSVNSIKELPENIGDLSSLLVLNVGSNCLKELPESFTGLVNLTSLNVSSNNLIALPDEMFEFVNLTDLNIAGNQIDTLPNTICELQKLEYLSLENNNLRVLPIQFGNLHMLHHFGKEQIQGNPIEQPPIEVFEQGLEGVVAYFEELKLSNPIEVPRVKALLLGEVAAGKTSLCNAIRLGKSNLTDITDRTAGIEVHPAQLQDSIQVLMHDFGGHKIYHLTHQFFFSKVALYLIVVDLEAFIPSSFDAAVKYWLNVIKARIDSKPVLRIVATHIDRCDSEEIQEKAGAIMKKMTQIEKIEVESLKKHLKDIDDALNRAGTPCSDWCHSLEGFDTQSLRRRKKFIEHLIDNRPIFPEHVDLVSCDPSLAGITQLIENIVISCQDYRLFPRRILPKSWFELELAIKTLKQEGHLRYLSMGDVQKVAKEKANMTPTRLTRALKYLHDIGEIVHFSDSPKLSDFVFHKPQWLMDVFKLIYKPVERFDERFASVSDADFDDMVEDFSSRGIVSEQMIQCLWKQMNLSKPEESMLISLLQKFDLCFQMPTENTVSNVYRFPWLLSDSAPQQFEQCWKQKISFDEEVLMIVFQIQNYCPVGLFETLSVKLDKYVICRKDWKYGIIAVSEVGEKKILVQLEPKERSEEIVISVQTKSKELNQAWEVMVLIINATKELLQQWPGVLYCVRVVCSHCLKQGVDKPHRFSGAVLDKAPRGICPETMEKIDPRLIHPEISPAQWQQKRKRALAECGKSPAPEEIMIMEKQPRYSGPEPGNTVRNSAAVHTTHISKDCHAQNNADTENVWERFRGMSIDIQPGDEGNRLAAHLRESGLTLRPDVPRDGNCLFHAVSDQLVRTGSQSTSHSQLRQDVVSYLRQHPYNGQGDHLRAFVPNEDWEGYLQGMSQNRVWGDHIVLQALASMLGRDIRIVSSIDADNYTTILTPMGNQQDTTGPPPLLLGLYAENHYASLDVFQRCVVLLVSDEYGTSKGGISTINQQLAQLLRRFGAIVYCTVLWVTREDQEEARKDGVHLIEPSVQPGDTREPSLDWLTFDHHICFRNLPKDVGYIVGHSGITDKAAENIKNGRYPQAKLFTFNHTIPEDTEHYKGGGKPLKAWVKEKDLLKVAAAADAAFSVGKRIYDHFETMYKGDKKPKNHHLFLPKPSETFENTHVKPGGEQKVVLSIGRVKNVEQLKGHDLAARAVGKAAEVIANIRMRVRGISEDDYETSKKILEDNLQSGRLKPTLIPYGTQKEISDDMKTAHLVLMPSRAEPFGLVGLEALAAGIPVLISSQSGLADLINDLILTGKCDADLRHRIVKTSVNVSDLDTDACKWAEKIVDTLRYNDQEFQKAALFKQQLQESKYWEESHQIFLQACGITNTSKNSS